MDGDLREGSEECWGLPCVVLCCCSLKSSCPAHRPLMQNLITRSIFRNRGGTFQTPRSKRWEEEEQPDLSFPCKRGSSLSRNISGGVEWFDQPLAVFSVRNAYFWCFSQRHRLVFTLNGSWAHYHDGYRWCKVVKMLLWAVPCFSIRRFRENWAERKAGTSRPLW